MSKNIPAKKQHLPPPSKADQPQFMAEVSSSLHLKAKSKFQKFINDIAKFYIDARMAQVQFAWGTGRRIVEEEQDGDMHAAYGSELLLKLSKALFKKHGSGFSERNLRRMRQFYLTNQKRSVPTELDWTAYVEMLPVKDGKLRKQIEARALREGLNSREVRQLVKDTRKSEMKNANNSSSSELKLKNTVKISLLKSPTGLVFNTFSVSVLNVELKAGQVLIDCGFFVRWPVDKKMLKTLDLREKFYTYAATIDRVVDGDTLVVLIEVGFGIIVYDRLRLRGINCPEMSLLEGVRAKKFVQKLLPVGSRIVIKSHKCKRDIYGRFVADVLFRKGVKDEVRILDDAVYLNQLLLDKGHAEIY